MKQSVLVTILLTVLVPIFAKEKAKKKQKISPDIVSVALRHTACYGRCRVFTIEVNKNGLATYTATLFNKDTGVFTKNIGAAAAGKIISRFAANRVDTCRDLYESRTPDVPGFVFTINYGSKTKTINDARSGPPFLTQLSGAMDSLVGDKVDKSWKRTSAK